MKEYIEYLERMIAQEEEALEKCKNNSFDEEVENAIKRRLNSFKNDLENAKNQLN